MHINLPDSALVIMKSDQRFDHPSYGFRDVIFFEERDMYLAINSEMSAINRLDKYLTTSKLPWKNKPLTMETLKEKNKKKIAHLEFHAKIKNNLNELTY